MAAPFAPYYARHGDSKVFAMLCVILENTDAQLINYSVNIQDFCFYQEVMCLLNVRPGLSELSRHFSLAHVVKSFETGLFVSHSLLCLFREQCCR